MEGVSLLAGSLWLSWECWGLVELPRASVEQTEPRLPLGHNGFVLAWQGLPIPAKGSLVPPAPAARGFFPLPCGKASPTAITQLLLPCPESRLHLQISKASWALYSPTPCCVRDLYFILIYLSVGLSLSLLLFQAFQQVCSAESCRLAMKYDKAFI